MEECYELLEQYALNSGNYKDWRKVHTKMFGEIFSSSFSENEEAQIHLTAALIDLSNRQYKQALPKLSILEALCVKTFDCAAVDYFMGLNYELLEDECKMNESYEKLRDSNVAFVFPLSFHPFYRTAKFAQREAECKKALFYYQKALSFYSADSTDRRITSALSHIVYDMATVFLYTHHYDECREFLALSNQYDSKSNQHRTYVTAILCAIQGQTKDAVEYLESMNPFLQENCRPMIKAISERKDLHYYAVPQDRTGYPDFWENLAAKADELESIVRNGNTSEASTIISELLSKTLSFMKKTLVCRVEGFGDSIHVLCKNDHVKTLIAEYEALFSVKPARLQNWKFSSVNEFEVY